MTSAPKKPESLDAPLEGRQLIRAVVALPELSMRITWLGEKLEGKSDEFTAASLEQITAASQRAEDAARECVLALAVLFARRRESAWLWALHETSKVHCLMNLERLLRPAPTDTPLSRPTPELPVPDFGNGRPLSVGERKSLARRPSRTQIERLLHDPHPLVLAQLLASPSLTEDDVVLLATKRPAYIPALELLLDSSRWIIRRRVRLSIILNPGCPHGLAAPLLVTCPREDLKLIVETTTISVVLRAIAHELYLKLPPLRTDIQMAGLH